MKRRLVDFTLRCAFSEPEKTVCCCEYFTVDGFRREDGEWELGVYTPNTVTREDARRIEGFLAELEKVKAELAAVLKAIEDAYNKFLAEDE